MTSFKYLYGKTDKIMSLQERVAAFSELGRRIKTLDYVDLSELAARVENNNNWFTPEQTRFALESISSFLDEGGLWAWLRNYSIPDDSIPKAVGLLLAGNVPAVGFHDMMCVLLSGHAAHIKLSSTDKVLIPWMAEELVKINPDFAGKIRFEDMLRGKDAYIATGSDNSSRYFDYYFGRFPSIIRKNRTSVGILNGSEQSQDWEALYRDIFQYFGLGCRNVSKLYVRERAQLQEFLGAMGLRSDLLDHHKYRNNYEYNKAIYLVNGEPHLDNGFLLLKEAEALVSPIAVLHFETYSDPEDLGKLIGRHTEKIQCMVSKDGWYPGSIGFGQAQRPKLEEYADQKDTMAFLLSL